MFIRFPFYEQHEPFDFSIKKSNLSHTPTLSYNGDSEDSCLGSEQEQRSSPEGYQYMRNYSSYSENTPINNPQEEPLTLTTNSANKIYTPRPFRPSVILSYPNEAISPPDYHQNYNIQTANTYVSYTPVSSTTTTLNSTPMSMSINTYTPTSSSMPTSMSTTPLTNSMNLSPLSPPSSRISTMIKVKTGNQNIIRPFKMIPKELLDTKSEEFLEFQKKKMLAFHKKGPLKAKVGIKRSASPNDGSPYPTSTFDKGVKDEAYWERRRKNNEAAKRSRDARRAKEDAMALQLCALSEKIDKIQYENHQLRETIKNLTYANSILQTKLQ